MQLPVNPPVAPMLARPVPQIPEGPFSFEPKWDGFRSVVFVDRGEVEIGSRNERPMTRYFPEVAEALTANLPSRCVVDGEIVIPDSSGRKLDFEALLQRIHPAASRVALLAEQTPAHFVAFDLLALDDTDLCGQPFAERRAALERALAQARSPVHLTPATTDRDLAGRWFRQFEGAGLDGLIAKPLDGTYQPDKRVMFKIKHERTADCVVAGYRPHKSSPDAVGSLLLGLYTEAGDLASVGVVGAFPMARRRELFTELQPLVTTFDGHPWRWGGSEGAGGASPGGRPPGTPRESPARGDTPAARPTSTAARNPRSAEVSRWNAGKDLSFVPLRPERVVEVRYDHMEGRRFRHTTQFARWRPDRDPRSCTYAQLEEPVNYDLAEILAHAGG
jgi:ATP-dependent DNA ligase